MQINFSTEFPEFDARLLAIGKETNKLQAKDKNPLPEDKRTEPNKIEHLQNLLAEHDITLKFSRNEETNQLIVELIDSRTGESVRQIPSEVAVRLCASLSKLSGQIVDERV